ncbi:Brix domain-containing protein [Blastocladiella britannica]|nr:Brix domain-containing protein [Blastocladiella britannica]
MARRRKNRTHKKIDEATLTFPPRSFVVKSGDVGKPVAHLIQDLRAVMAPNTAAKLKERKTNKLRDYVAMSGPMHVSHLMVFSRASASGSLNLRIGKMPRGPTVNFRVKSYSLSHDIAAALRSPKAMSGAMFLAAPLLVLNNFPTDRAEYKLLATVLQNLYPAINVAQLRIAQTRRVVLFNYNAESDTVDFRHYAIDVKATGVTKGVKKILTLKDLPSLEGFADIADYIQRETNAAESDMEDAEDPTSTLTLPQRYAGRNNRASEQRAIKLTELGPRMDLSLVKITDGLCAGEVMYHKYVTKSASEVAATRASIDRRERERAQRRAVQAANVARKKAEKQARRDARRAAGRSELSDESEEEDEEVEVQASDDDDEYARDLAYQATEAADDFDDDVDLDHGSEDEEDGPSMSHLARVAASAAQLSGGASADESEDDDEEEEETAAPPPTKRAKTNGGGRNGSSSSRGAAKGGKGRGRK